MIFFICYKFSLSQNTKASPFSFKYSLFLLLGRPMLLDLQKCCCHWVAMAWEQLEYTEWTQKC